MSPLAFTTCSDDPPAGATLAPDPPKYTGGTCPKLTTGNTQINTITSSGVARQFMVIAPASIQQNEKLPVVFLWHWLNASAESFYERADTQAAVDEQRFIAIIPESIGSAPADWRGWFSANPQSQEDEEFVFFDDMLACVSEQFPVNKNCVSTAGVSDGALWSSQLIGGRGQYLSSAIIMSGGVNNPSSQLTGLIRPYIPSTHAMPVIVLWGGPTDVCIVLPFADATAALEQALIRENHFIVECQHNCGHSEPPFTAPSGSTKFSALWQFVKDHPYWLPAGRSPYETGTLPSGFPSWCAVGPGCSVPPTDTSGCGGPGC